MAEAGTAYYVLIKEAKLTAREFAELSDGYRLLEEIEERLADIDKHLALHHLQKAIEALQGIMSDIKKAKEINIHVAKIAHHVDDLIDILEEQELTRKTLAGLSSDLERDERLLIQRAKQIDKIFDSIEKAISILIKMINDYKHTNNPALYMKGVRSAYNLKNYIENLRRGIFKIEKIEKALIKLINMERARLKKEAPEALHTLPVKSAKPTLADKFRAVFGLAPK